MMWDWLDEHFDVLIKIKALLNQINSINEFPLSSDPFSGSGHFVYKPYLKTSF